MSLCFVVISEIKIFSILVQKLQFLIETIFLLINSKSALFVFWQLICIGLPMFIAITDKSCAMNMSLITSVRGPLYNIGVDAV